MKLLTNRKLRLVFLLALATGTAFVFRFGQLTPAHVRLRDRFGSRAALDSLPNTFLWAWERPERLDFIDTQHTGVAYLARTIRLSGNTISVRPRVQPLILTEGTKVIAVVRIESARDAEPSLSETQIADAVQQIAEVGKVIGVVGIQIDFDAKASERDFYRQLLFSVRGQLPPTIPLSMTALASWCAGDNWLSDLPVDEVVPMLFRLGVDRLQFLSRLQSSEEPFAQPCNRAAGVSTDEVIRPPTTRRVYIFSPTSWTPASVNTALETYRR